MQSAGESVKAKIVTVALLITWIIVLFPIAMSEKVSTLIAYAFICFSAVLVAIKRSRAFFGFLAIGCTVFLATIFIPVDIRVNRGDTFGVKWIRADDLRAKEAGVPVVVEGTNMVVFRHPDRSIGVKAQRILQVSLPAAL
jgi:cell division protein FtsW (lipid II flippase)